MSSFLMLAKNYVPGKSHCGGWYCSEKLDGMRCFWDGGITKGLFASEVPFANTEKDARLVKRVKCTGLWSRYGKVIQAPESFLENFEGINFPLDGELWIERGKFQELISIAKRFVDNGFDYGWTQINYYIFDTPSWEEFCSYRSVNEVHFKKMFGWEIREWILTKLKELKIQQLHPFPFGFESIYNFLLSKFEQNNNVIKAMYQRKLDPKNWIDQLEHFSNDCRILGGEGLMLRKYNSFWKPKRIDELLKVKKVNDSEGVILGFQPGKGKYEGMIGSCLIDWKGKQFELSGFTDEERQWGYFKVGETITFTYRELTDKGIPREARYLRKFHNG